MPSLRNIGVKPEAKVSLNRLTPLTRTNMESPATYVMVEGLLCHSL